MSKQVIIANTRADIDAINNKLGEMIGVPITNTYRGEAAPDSHAKFTCWQENPIEILYGTKAGKWYIYDVKDKWFTSQMKAEFTRWLNQNIQGYAREVYDPNWLNE